MVDEVSRLRFALEANTAQFERQMKRVEAQMKRSTDAIRNQARRADREVSRFGAEFGAGLARVGGPVAIAAAFGKLGQSVAQAGEQVRVMTGRFEALTGSAERAGMLVKGVFDVAGGTGSSLESVSQLVSQMRLATGEIGASDEEVVKFSENLIRLGIIGGSSAAEVANGLRQLSQGLAGGVLRAEEFNSVIENTPLVAKALADELAGGSLGALRAMVLEGKVLARDVLRAMLNQTERIAEQFEKVPTTMGRAFSTLGTETTRLLSNLDEMLGVSNGIANAFRGIAQALAALNTQFETTQFEAYSDALEKLEELERRRAVRPESQRGAIDAEIAAQRAKVERLLAAASAPPASGVPAPLAAAGDQAARTGGGGRAAAEGSAYADLLARMRETNQERREEIRLLGLSGSARIEEAAAIERTRLSNALYAAAARDGRAVTQAQREEIETYVEVTIELSRQLANAETAQRAQADAIEASARAAEDAKRNIEQIGNALTASITQANSFSGALKNVALQLANIAIQGLFGAGPAAGLGAALFGPPADFGIRGPIAPSAKGNVFSQGNVVPFAKGGIVGGPTLFPMPKGLGLMGEAGPEAILPLKRGPGGRLGVEAGGGGGGAVVINVDARGATDPAATGAAVRAALAQSEANTVRIVREMQRRGR